MALFLDGLGLSGVLPAPLVIFATFVGYMSGGLAGALAITAGMFLPAFAFSLIFYERLEAIADHARLQLFLAGVATAALAHPAAAQGLPEVTVTKDPSCGCCGQTGCGRGAC